MRSVCKRMDLMCGSHLNLGFRNAEKYHTQLMKKFKSREVVPQTKIMSRDYTVLFSAFCSILKLSRPLVCEGSYDY